MSSGFLLEVSNGLSRVKHKIISSCLFVRRVYQKVASLIMFNNDNNDDKHIINMIIMMVIMVIIMIIIIHVCIYSVADFKGFDSSVILI